MQQQQHNNGNDIDSRRRYNDDDNSWQCDDDDNDDGRWRYNDGNDGWWCNDVASAMTWLTINKLHFNVNLETKWLHGKHVSHPQNHHQATTNIMMERLPLGNVVTRCAIAGVNRDDTGT